jgi:hypothetical protein
MASSSLDAAAAACQAVTAVAGLGPEAGCEGSGANGTHAQQPMGGTAALDGAASLAVAGTVLAALGLAARAGTEGWEGCQVGEGFSLDYIYRQYPLLAISRNNAHTISKLLN